MILLVGSPGAGKSTFCHQVVLQSVAADRPVIYVVTEKGPLDVERILREKGLRKIDPRVLTFVDA